MVVSESQCDRLIRWQLKFSTLTRRGCRISERSKGSMPQIESQANALALMCGDFRLIPYQPLG